MVVVADCLCSLAITIISSIELLDASVGNGRGCGVEIVIVGEVDVEVDAVVILEDDISCA